MEMETKKMERNVIESCNQNRTLDRLDNVQLCETQF